MKKSCQNCFHVFNDKDEKGSFLFCEYDWWAKKQKRELEKKSSFVCKKWHKIK
jgi:hypothetical protein